MPGDWVSPGPHGRLRGCTILPACSIPPIEAVCRLQALPRAWAGCGARTSARGACGRDSPQARYPELRRSGEALLGFAVDPRGVQFKKIRYSPHSELAATNRRRRSERCTADVQLIVELV